MIEVAAALVRSALSLNLSDVGMTEHMVRSNAGSRGNPCGRSARVSCLPRPILPEIAIGRATPSQVVCVDPQFERIVAEAEKGLNQAHRA